MFPPPLYYGNRSVRDMPNENAARTNATLFNQRHQFPVATAAAATAPSEASSQDISTVSSFERFVTAPTPPPFVEDPKDNVSLPPKTSVCDSPLPVYVEEATRDGEGEKKHTDPLATSLQLDAPAPAFIQPARSIVNNDPAGVPAPQDSAAPKLNLRVPLEQWRFGL